MATHRGVPFLFEAPAEAQAAEAVWVQICRAGEYRGYPGYDLINFTRPLFERVAANVRRHPAYRAGPDGWGTAAVVPYDYEHASEMAPTSGTIPVSGAPAPAWALDLDVRESEGGDVELWALTEFGTAALAQIRAGGYRWTSVAIAFDARDPVSGEELGPVLTSIALTNHPFVQGMAPIVARLRPGAPAHEFWAALRSELPRLEPEPAEGPPRSDMAESQSTLARDLARILQCRDSDESILAAVQAAYEEKKKMDDALKALSETLGSDEMGEMLSRAAEQASRAQQLAPALEALAAAREALKGRADQDAEDEAAEVAEGMSSGNEQLAATLKHSLLAARKLCVRDDGTVDEAALAKFRETHKAYYRANRDLAGVVLTSTIAAGPGGAAPGKARPESRNGEVATVLLASGERATVKSLIASHLGRNDIERAVAYLSQAHGESFSSMSWERRCTHAAHFIRTGQLPSA